MERDPKELKGRNTRPVSQRFLWAIKNLTLGILFIENGVADA